MGIQRVNPVISAGVGLELSNGALGIPGFSQRAAAQTWGNQIGDFVYGLNAPGAAAIAFRRNNPASGQLSIVLDGTVYVEEGMKRVATRNDLSDYVKATNHAIRDITDSGVKRATVAVPSGYKLACERPIGAFTSGDAASYVTDRSCTQSGSTVSLTFYVYNPRGTAVHLNYSLLWVKVL